jgi:hypothetical protein
MEARGQGSGKSRYSVHGKAKVPRLSSKAGPGSVGSEPRRLCTINSVAYSVLGCNKHSCLCPLTMEGSNMASARYRGGES